MTDLEHYLEVHIRRVKRETRRIVIFWSSLLFAICAVVFAITLCISPWIKYPGWFVQAIEDKIRFQLPVWSDAAESAAGLHAPVLARNVTDEGIPFIRAARRNAERELKRYSEAFAKKIDTDLQLILTKLVSGDRVALATITESASNRDVFAKEDIIGQRLSALFDHHTKSDPRLESADILIAITGKLRMLEQTTEPTIEEELEKEILRTVLNYLTMP